MFSHPCRLVCDHMWFKYEVSERIGTWDTFMVAALHLATLGQASLANEE